MANRPSASKDGRTPAEAQGDAASEASERMVEASRSSRDRALDLIEALILKNADWWRDKSHCRGEMRELGVPDDADATQVSMGDLRAIEKAITEGSETPTASSAATKENITLLREAENFIYECTGTQFLSGPAGKNAVADRKWVREKLLNAARNVLCVRDELEHAPVSMGAPAWTPCSERLPCDHAEGLWSDPVLALFDSGSMHVQSCIRYSTGESSWGLPPGVTAKVTHWMYLPESPRGERHPRT